MVLDATLPPVGLASPLDVRASYLQQHLPGAVFFDIEELSGHSSDLPHMLPRPESFAAAMSELGVGSEMTIVVYEQENVFSAPRAWWMLRTLGAPSVHILDGGLRAWIEAGYPVESGPVQRRPAIFNAKLDPAAVRSFKQMQQTLAANDQVLDARSAGRFHGTAPEPRPGIRSGHMPVAMNVPYTDLTNGNRMKTQRELAEVFATKYVSLRSPIVTTCGSGVTAAVVLLALEICGAEKVSLYDGSWAEYAQMPEAVIEGANQLPRLD